MSASPMEVDSPLPNGNSAAAPPSKFGKLAESLKLEHQLLRVPFEHYKKTIRANHRAVEKEVSAVISGVSDAADSDLSRDDAVNQLNCLVSRLQGLKRKVYYAFFPLLELITRDACFILFCPLAQ